MNAELPPFKNGEHNSESASTFDGDITPLILRCSGAINQVVIVVITESFSNVQGL